MYTENVFARLNIFRLKLVFVVVVVVFLRRRGRLRCLPTRRRGSRDKLKGGREKKRIKEQITKKSTLKPRRRVSWTSDARAPILGCARDHPRSRVGVNGRASGSMVARVLVIRLTS